MVLAGSAVVRAQASGERLTPEVRMDAIVAAHRTSLQAGGGVQVPAGYYARIGLIAAAGTDVVPGGREASGRLDLVGRFLLDPFRQTPWGLSVGAGLSLRARSGDRVRPYLVTVVDIEGPRGIRGMAPSLQLGVGGGVRLGAAVRWVPRQTR
jgi:hypothetical protein